MKKNYKKLSFLLAAKINSRLKEKKIRKQQLAKLVGALPSQVSRWCSGDCNYTMQTLVALDQVLGLGFEKWVTNGEFVVYPEAEDKKHQIALPDRRIIITIDVLKNIEHETRTD